MQNELVTLGNRHWKLKHLWSLHIQLRAHLLSVQHALQNYFEFWLVAGRVAFCILAAAMYEKDLQYDTMKANHPTELIADYGCDRQLSCCSGRQLEESHPRVHRKSSQVRRTCWGRHLDIRHVEHRSARE